MKSYRFQNAGFAAWLMILILPLLLSACGSGQAAGSEPAVTPDMATPMQPTRAPAVSAETTGTQKPPVVIESGGDVPFYARFGENETFDDGEWTVIVFYRPPGCIPSDFNLNRFFHFPEDNSPGAFACAPPTTTSVETWQNGPQTDSAPLISQMTGRGAVPVWFVANDDVATAAADGVVTIAELMAAPSRLEGAASTYTERLHPTQSNARPLIQFSGEGTLADGRAFTLAVSKGANDTADHVTISFSTGE